MRNRWMSSTLIITFLLTVMITLPLGEVLEQIVAQVNNDIITLTQFNQEKELLTREFTRRFEGDDLNQKLEMALRYLLNNMIEEMLLTQKAEEFGMAEDLELEANAVIDDMMKSNNIPTKEILIEEMAKAGMPYNEFYTNLRKNILVNRLKGAMVRQKVKIMAQDVETYYNEHINEYTVPETIELQEIVMYTEGKNEADVRMKIEDIRTRLFQGKDFSELAKTLSEGPTADKGGSIGSFPVSSLSAVMQQAARSLSEGQYTDIIKTDFGFMIVKLVKRTPPSKKPLVEVRDQIEDALFRQQINPILENYIKELREDAYIKVFPDFEDQYHPMTETKEIVVKEK